MNHEAMSIMYPYTQSGVHRFLELDRSFIGTQDYMGAAYFWNHEYRHYLRDASPYRRKLVHNAFLKAGLAADIHGNTPTHTAIVTRYLGP